MEQSSEAFHHCFRRRLYTKNSENLQRMGPKRPDPGCGKMNVRKPLVNQDLRLRLSFFNCVGRHLSSEETSCLIENRMNHLYINPSHHSQKTDFAHLTALDSHKRGWLARVRFLHVHVRHAATPPQVRTRLVVGSHQELAGC